MKYIVFSVYYKYGNYNTEIFHDEDAIEKFCISKLKEYGYSPYLKFNNLLEFTVAKGREAIDKQAGWGVVDIIKCEEFQRYKPSDKDIVTL